MPFIGNIVYKIRSWFGPGKSKQEVELEKRIQNAEAKINDMNEKQRDHKKENERLDEKIAELKRELAATPEDSSNVDTLCDQIEALQKESNQRHELFEQMLENIRAQTTIRNKSQQLLEQLKNGVDIDIVVDTREQIGDMMKDREEANKVIEELDKSGRKQRAAESEKSEEEIKAERAARRASMMKGVKPAAAPAKETTTAAPETVATPAVG